MDGLARSLVSALTPFLGLLFCVGAHIVASRMAPGLPRHHAAAGGVVLGLALVSGAGVWVLVDPAEVTVPDRWATVAAWLLTYLSLAYFYVFGFFNLGESARRIRLLIELQAAGERGLTLEQILRAYNARMIIDARLQRLLASGQIVERDGRYTVGTPVMLSLAKLLVFLKVVLLRSRSEFEAIAGGEGHGVAPGGLGGLPVLARDRAAGARRDAGQQGGKRVAGGSTWPGSPR